MDMMIYLFAAFLSVPSFAGEVSFHAGPERTHLVELYSSEGCSSCPPADEWIVPLRAHARVWKDFVPVVFHVDYWDYLGWKDRYADPAFSARQRAYAAAWGSRSVYTPGFVLDGTEWRGWGGEPPSAGPAAGSLTATLASGKWRVRFSPAVDAGGYDVFVARLAFGIESPVAGGENAGRTLRHEFVVRGLSRARMNSTDGLWTALVALPADSAAAPRRSGAAIWVTDASGRPVQAAGGILP